MFLVILSHRVNQTFSTFRIVAQEYTVEEEKADALLRYRSRSRDDYDEAESSEDEIKHVDDDEETDHKLEETLKNWNKENKPQRSQTLDLSLLSTLGSGTVNKAVSGFMSKLKSPHDNSKKNNEEEIQSVPDDKKEPVTKTNSEEVEVRTRKSSSVKSRFKSMVQRRSMWN